MEGFNNDFTSVKRSNPSFYDAGRNNENEPNPETAFNLKKQLPSKNFMSPTISASNKTAFPKKKILAERNQTLDDVEQTSLLRSPSLDSKAANFPVDGESCLQAYDPIKNYLSPRPKFLRYNPNRRRKIFYENGVKSSSSSFDSGVTSFGLEKRRDSCGSTGSCSEKESVEEVKGTIELEDEGEGNEEDEEMVEFGEDKGCGLKGFLKFLVVVIALISTTQAICSMNSPNPSLESVWGFSDLNVHGVAGLNFSEVVDPIMESGFLVERLKEEEIFYHDIEVENDEIDVIQDVDPIMESGFLVERLKEEEVFYPDNEVENDEIDVIQDVDQLQLIEMFQENEIAESEVMEIPNVEAEIEVLDQDLNQDFDQEDANEKNSQLIIDDIETAKEMEDGIEEIAELETTDVLIGLAGFDLIVSLLIGVSVLILTSFGVFFHSKRIKKKHSSPFATIVANKINLEGEKQDIKNPEPCSSFVNSAYLVKDPMPKHVSKEISSMHAPTVELLGEFVFGGEVTNSSYDTKSDTISASAQPTTVSSGQTRSSRKPRRKMVEVTPSPVRRSSRIQNRPAAAMSP